MCSTGIFVLQHALSLVPARNMVNAAPDDSDILLSLPAKRINGRSNCHLPVFAVQTELLTDEFGFLFYTKILTK
mgnify:CR=1 FL=1